MKFKRYPKIHRLGKDETKGILYGVVHVEEKIDGANAQIWISEGKIHCGSRNNTLCTDVDNIEVGSNLFNGFVEWCAHFSPLRAILADHPEYRLYGEWLVRHTINYKETAYQQFYLFDITIMKEDESEEEFLSKEEVMKLADEYGIARPAYHGSFTNPTEEELSKFVGLSAIGDKGEGIVLKNPDYRDKFGSHNYAKIVTQEFKEGNAITFGGNNKFSDTYWEMLVINKYINAARVTKIIHKLESEVGKLDLQHTPRVVNTVYHDVLTEEIWEIQKKAMHLDFRHLARLAGKKTVQVYKDILSGSISVADL